MKIMIVTDAWEPQVNGVVRTLKNTTRELTELGHRVDLLTPLEFRTIPCPTYPEIRLSLMPRRKLRQRIGEFAPDADTRWLHFDEFRMPFGYWKATLDERRATCFSVTPRSSSPRR